MSLFVWLLFFIILLFVVCPHLFALYFRRFPDGEGGKIEGNYQNIYYILLDAHPSREAFRQLGGDLKSFYCELERLGFITYPASKSVYPRTVESVASVWHMDTEVHDSIIDSVALKTLMKTYTVRFYLGFRYLLWLYGYPAVDNVKLVSSRDLLFALDVLLERSLLCRYYDRVSGGANKKE